MCCKQCTQFGGCATQNTSSSASPYQSWPQCHQNVGNMHIHLLKGGFSVQIISRGMGEEAEEKGTVQARQSEAEPSQIPPTRNRSTQTITRRPSTQKRLSSPSTSDVDRRIISSLNALHYDMIKTSKPQIMDRASATEMARSSPKGTVEHSIPPSLPKSQSVRKPVRQTKECSIFKHKYTLFEVLARGLQSLRVHKIST